MIDLRSDALHVAEATSLVVAALFPIVNPLGSAAIFINMIGPVQPAVHRLLVQKIALFSSILLVGSMLFGAKVLLFFGISIYAVQIGGGLIVAATGWSLLNQSGEAVRASGALNPDEILATAFYPYTMPITVGPGAISVAVTLGAHLPSELHATSIFSPEVLVASLVGIAIVCFIIYICYRYAGPAKRRLGTSGTSIVMRISSFILMCIGVQIVSVGLRAYVATLKL